MTTAMAQIGKDDGFDRKALDPVEKYLGTEHGLLLQYPAYKTYNSDWGEMTSYPQGVKENGAVFCHCNPWTIIAEAMYGNAERAFADYTRIAPAWREEISEIHRCEPYVYAQMIAGKESPRFGEAKNSWLTGTAGDGPSHLPRLPLRDHDPQGSGKESSGERKNR